MTRRLSVKDARAHFSDLLGQVYYGNEPVIVEKKGRPMAVLISPEQWERYRQLTKERFFDAVDRIQERNQDGDPEEIEAYVTAVVEDVRRERHERR